MKVFYLQFFEMIRFHVVTTHEVPHGHTWPPRQYSGMPCLPAWFYRLLLTEKQDEEYWKGTECLPKGKKISQPARSPSPSSLGPSGFFCSFPHDSIGTQHPHTQQESICLVRRTWWKPQEIQLNGWTASSSLFLREKIWSWFSWSLS